MAKIDQKPDEAAARALRGELEERTMPGDVAVELVSTHPRSPAAASLSAALVASLAGDLP